MSVGLALGTREEWSNSVTPCCGAEDSLVCLGEIPWGKWHREVQRWTKKREFPVSPQNLPASPDHPLMGTAVFIRTFSLAWNQV